jgi:hypothetical protein
MTIALLSCSFLDNSNSLAEDLKFLALASLTAIALLSCSKNNLSQLYTKEEGERLQKMFGTYNATFDVVYEM